jgi:superfamily II DNA or RNA helicase
MSARRRQQLFARLAAFRDLEQRHHPRQAGRITDDHLEQQAALAEALSQRLAGDRIAPAVVLASPTGTGKTIVALAAALQNLHDLDRFDRVALIAPNAHVSSRWLERAEQMADDPVTVVARRQAPQRHQIVAFTLGTLPERRLPARTLVILDEAHRGTQNPGQTTYQQLQTVCHNRAVVLVSATPYQLSTSGLISMLSVNASRERQAELQPVRQLAQQLRPIIVRGKDEELPTPDQLDELAATAAASREVIDHHLVRPTRSGDDHGLYRPHPDSQHTVDLDDPQWARAYWVARTSATLTDAQVTDTFNRALDSSSEAFRSSAVAKACRRQGGETAVLAEQLNAALGTREAHPKVQATCDWVTYQARQGRHVLVFTYFLATQRALAAALRARLPDVEVKAPTATDLPDQLADRFRQPAGDASEAIVLVVSEKFSESIDLDGGRPCVVHHDLHWNPNRIRQRMGRVTRLSSGYQPVAPHDVFIPVLDTPTDQRMYDTVLKRFSLGDLLVPAELEADLDNVPPEVRDAVLGLAGPDESDVDAAV